MNAWCTACARSRKPTLPKMLFTWVFTLASLTKSSPAISLFDRPAAIRPRTSASRGDRPSGNAARAEVVGADPVGDAVATLVAAAPGPLRQVATGAGAEGSDGGQGHQDEERWNRRLADLVAHHELADLLAEATDVRDGPDETDPVSDADEPGEEERGTAACQQLAGGRVPLDGRGAGGARRPSWVSIMTAKMLPLMTRD